MLGYRYYLTVDGEDQDAGIFRAVDEILIPRREREHLMTPFNTKLKIPPYSELNCKVIAFFTKKGNDEFADAILALMKAYSNHSLYEVESIEVEIPDENIVYQDEFQFLSRKE